MPSPTPSDGSRSGEPGIPEIPGSPTPAPPTSTATESPADGSPAPPTSTATASRADGSRADGSPWWSPDQGSRPVKVRG